MMWQKNVVLCGLLASSAGVALAKKEDNATFRIAHSLLSYSQVTDAAKVKTNSLGTHSADWEFMANKGKWTLYAAPGQIGKTFGIGFALTKHLELGFKVALKNEKTVPASKETTRRDLGLAVTHYLAIGKNTLESTLFFGSSASSDKVAAVGTTPATETKDSGSMFGVNFDFDLELADNFHTVHGLGYTKAGKTTTIDVRLWGVRYYI